MAANRSRLPYLLCATFAFLCQACSQLSGLSEHEQSVMQSVTSDSIYGFSLRLAFGPWAQHDPQDRCGPSFIPTADEHLPLGSYTCSPLGHTSGYRKGSSSFESASRPRTSLLRNSSVDYTFFRSSVPEPESVGSFSSYGTRPFS